MRRSRGRHTEEESFLASSADLMACVLFVFILLAVVFAIKAKDTAVRADQAAVRADEAAVLAETAKAKAKDLQRKWDVTKAEQQAILNELKSALQRQGIVVSINQENDGLQFGDGSLTFESCSKDLRASDGRNLAVLAKELEPVLAAHAYPCSQPAGTALLARQPVDVVLIEGHTDKTRPVKGCGFPDNWALSAARAAATREKLLDANQGLSQLCNTERRPMFAIAGYADQRPVDKDNDAQNRRIEFRFIMRPPTDESSDEAHGRPAK